MFILFANNNNKKQTCRYSASLGNATRASCPPPDSLAPSLSWPMQQHDSCNIVRTHRLFFVWLSLALLCSPCSLAWRFLETCRLLRQASARHPSRQPVNQSGHAWELGPPNPGRWYGPDAGGHKRGTGQRQCAGGGGLRAAGPLVMMTWTSSSVASSLSTRVLTPAHLSCAKHP